MDPVEPNDRSTADRLAELVVHLTDCDPQHALALIDPSELGTSADVDDKLEVVARAMVRLRRAPEPPTVDLRPRVDVRHRVDLRQGVDLRAGDAAETQPSP